MRKLILFASVSLDGFMAGPENDLGFMVEDEEMDREMTAELMRTADTIVVGRNAYQDMAAHWPHASDPFAQWQSGRDIVVFGGVRTVRSLVALGVIDEYRLKVNPVAVGRGGSVFGDITAPLKLKLLSTQAFASGTVAVYYGT